MVNSEVTLFVDWSQLKLVWCYLIVARLTRDAKFQSLYLKVFHKFRNTLWYGTEIVVIHLLVFCRRMSHQGASCEQQIGTGRVEAFVDEEVFLFPTEVGDDFLYLRIEILCYCCCSLVDGLQALQQWCLIVKSLTSIRDEDCWNHQGIAHYEDWRGWVPCRIPACLKGRADATRGEGRSVRLLLNERLARELFYHTTHTIMLNEGIMLLGSSIGERLEPVSTMGHTKFHSPLLHTVGNLVGCLTIEWGTIVYDIKHLGVGVFVKILGHLCFIKDVLGKEL